MIERTYSELIKLPTFMERYKYLKLNGQVGNETFGDDRFINQELYHSSKWLRFRDKIIIRDNGCDLGVPGFEITKVKSVNGNVIQRTGIILIHHLNPITLDDVINQRYCVFDPENVICTKLSTHNAIHYGNESMVEISITERTPDDTCPWKKQKEY